MVPPEEKSTFTLASGALGKRVQPAKSANVEETEAWRRSGRFRQ